MLDVELRVRNYRCFGDEPAVIRITDGFTAFIGVNNSGKSSMLRILYEIRPMLLTVRSVLATLAQGMVVSPGGLGWEPKVPAGERIIRAGSGMPAEIELTIHDSPAGPFAHYGELITISMVYDGNSGPRIRLEADNHLSVDVTGDVLSSSGSFREFLRESDMKPVDSTFDFLTRAMYVGPFRHAMNFAGLNSYDDIQTGAALAERFMFHKSSAEPVDNEAMFALMQELRQIFGFQSLDVNADADGKEFRLIVDGRSYRLNEQGAGLAHFLVVLVNALISKPSILLIDEPELNLHASLQLDFLTTLGRYAELGLVIFATHSLGLARTAADRIYTFTKPAGGASRVGTYESENELVTMLGQLAFDRRPELGFSKVLLVEGRTEIRAIMQLLRLYGKEHEVLLLPLHGSVMIHGRAKQELIEMLRIGGDVRYLIDSERTAEGEALAKDRQDFVSLCAELDIPGHVLERRAIENYFPQRAITRAFGDGYTQLPPYEKEAAGPRWRKVNNWQIAAEMRIDELEGTDLGQFLSDL